MLICSISDTKKNDIFAYYILHSFAASLHTDAAPPLTNSWRHNNLGKICKIVSITL